MNLHGAESFYASRQKPFQHSTKVNTKQKKNIRIEIIKQPVNYSKRWMNKSA